MNDLLSADARTGEVSIERWRTLEDRFRHACERYGFREVRTPVCEYTELFHRGVGDTTDIVEKEMYTFEDRGGRQLSLRPEGTASAVRAALEHGVLDRSPVVRWYYAGAMFRAERPAKGRYRQFHQLGAEVYGDASPAVDAEVIDLATSFVRSLGIGPFEVRLNSLGARDSRQRYRDALVAYFEPVKDQLSPESQSRLARNPLRILDSKDPRDAGFKNAAPTILDYLSDEDRAHFEKVKSFLDALGVAYVVDPRLVRGLDYYTQTVFEIVDTSQRLGAQDTLGAGGRYNNLFRELGSSKDVPAVGFALGIERLMLAAPEPVERKPFRVAVVAATKDELHVQGAAMSMARTLREAGFEAHVDTRFGSMKSQMNRADAIAATVVLVLGGNEVANGTVTLRDMALPKDSPDKQRDVARDAVVAELTRLRDAAETAR